MTADRPLRAHRLFLAGDLARELGRVCDGVRLLRAAQQTGLLPAEHAMASFHLESADSNWSGSTTIHDFARIAHQLVDSGEGERALQALSVVAVRAYWERLDDETRQIPIVTYTTEYEGQEPEQEDTEPSETEMFAPQPVIRMN